jgi:diacylglycerol kinase family enzyme
MAHYHLTLDGEEHEVEGLTCIIANSGATGSPLFTLSPKILIDDGLLDILVVRKSDFLSLLSLAASVVGGVENVNVMDHWQARSVTVNSDPPQVLQVDGEMLGNTPVTAKVLPQAVGFVTPAPPEENQS